MALSNQQDILNDMQNQQEIYRPTAFWAEASNLLIEDFKQYGLENFRQQGSPLRFFVPTYGLPGNGIGEVLTNKVTALFSEENVNAKQNSAMQQFLTGELSALSDYRTLLASMNENQTIQLSQFSESKVGNPKEHFEFDGKFFSRSALNYLLGLSFLQKHTDFSDINTVLEVGGGFGTLGEIILKTSKAKYIDVDIPPTCFASEYYLTEVFGSDKVSNYAETRQAENINIDDLKDASVLCSWQIEKLAGKVDLFVNFISFQEMEPEVVDNYLKNVKRLDANWVLLRNMREGKQKKTAHSVGVEEPILKDKYISMMEGYDLVESNVYPYGYKTVDGYHSELMLFKKQST